MKSRNLFVFVSVLFMSLGMMLGSCVEAALVSYWPFDGDATAVVGTDGIMDIMVQTVDDRNGTPGGALGFDGATFIDVPDGGGLGETYAGTISMWVKWDGLQTNFANLHYGTVLARQTIAPVFSNNLISLTGEDPATATVGWSSERAYERAITGTTVVGNSAWHHIAVTYQPHFTGECELFVDGVSQGTAATDAFSFDPTTRLTIGAWADVGTYAVASIDDVAFFDDMLSPTQIGALAAQTSTPLNVGNGTKPAELPLRGVVATASSELKAEPDSGWPYSWPTRYAGNVTDGVGRMTTTADGNAGQVEGMWESNGDGTYAGNGLSDPDPEITFDLGQVHQLSKMVVYNWNETNNTVAGVQEAEIFMSTDGVLFTSLGTHVFDEAPGDNTNPGQIVQLGGVSARYVKLDILSDYAGSTFPGSVGTVGLSEVDFYEGTGVLIPGDTDGNLIVNEIDAVVLATNWGNNVGTAGYSAGDFNDDGYVNAADAAILAANWGNHASPPESADLHSVPEPSGFAMVIVLAAMFFMQKPKR